MKNLDQRIEAARGRLWCPYANADSESYDADCIKGLCAHYNPSTHECAHVEALQALVRIADAQCNASYIQQYIYEKLTDWVPELLAKTGCEGMEDDSREVWER